MYDTLNHSQSIPTDRRKFVFLCLLLAALTLAVYWQVGSHQFISLDDESYITQNPHITGGLTLDNIRWAFTATYVANWHPLTWLSHMLDVELFGLNPKGHHLMNVAIHIVNSLLLFWLLVRLTGTLWRSWLVAALFALHPLHVESVAWAAERKDLLCGLFFMITLLLYGEYVRRGGWVRYLLTLAAFVLGLMAKPMLVTLPIVMLLLDYWPLARLDWSTCRHLLTEKVPFFFCSLLSGIVTIFAQQQWGAVISFQQLPLLHRCINALYAYVGYIGKLFWPVKLAIFYPMIELNAAAISSAVLALVLLIALLLRYEWLAAPVRVGLLWYLVMLTPVSGVLQVGGQAMADRYTYLPAIGFTIALIWLTPLSTRWYRRPTLIVVAGVMLVAYSAMTWHQLSYWRDSITLYRRTLVAAGASNLIHNDLGLVLKDAGRYDEAIFHYREALRLIPDNMYALSNLGVVLMITGQHREAINVMRNAVQVAPDEYLVHYNLGYAYEILGEKDNAINEFQAALRLNPGDKKALARLYALLNRGAGNGSDNSTIHSR